MKQFHLFIFFFFGWAMTSFAQTSQWKTFRNIEKINTFALDGNYIWIGTDAGLIRLDTITSETFHFDKTNSGLNHDDIRNITIDNKGDKWISTKTGLCWYNDSVWKKISDFSEGSYFDYFQNEIQIDTNHNIWTATPYGLFSYKKNDPIPNFTYTVYNSSLPSHKVKSIAFDTNHSLWIASGGDEYGNTIYRNVPQKTVNQWKQGWVSQYDGKQFINNTIDSMYFPYNDIRCIAIDKQNIIWLGTNMGLASFDGKKWTAYRRSKYYPDYKPIGPGGVVIVLSSKSDDYLKRLEYYVQDICIDIEGSIWVAMVDCLIKNKDGVWAIYDKKETHYQSDYIYAITSDSSGTIWVASKNQIQKFDGNASWTTIYTLPEKILERQNIQHISIDKANNKWIISSGNVLLYDSLNVIKGNFNIGYYDSKTDKSTERYRILKKYLSNQFNCDISNLHLTNYPDISLLSWMKNSVKDKNGTIWIASESLWKWNDSTIDALEVPLFKSYKITTEGMILDTNSLLWIIDRWGKIRTFDGVGWELRKIPKKIIIKINQEKKKRYRQYRTKRRYQDFDIILNTIAVDKNNYKIFGTSDGLIIYNGTNWILYNSKNSKIPSYYNSIETIAVDSNNYIWLGCSDGLIKFDGKNWKQYTEKNSSLPSNGVKTIAVDTHNNIWIGTDKGVAIFNENGIK